MSNRAQLFLEYLQQLIIETPSLKECFEQVEVEELNELYKDYYATANSSSEGFEEMVNIILSLNSDLSFINLLDNASCFECLLASYALLFLDEHEQNNSTAVSKFEQMLISMLRPITRENAVFEDKVEICQRVRQMITHFARDMLKADAQMDVGQGPSHEILNFLYVKMVLAYLMYVESQPDKICNYAEFSLPILRLLSAFHQQSKDEAPIDEIRLKRFIDKIEQNWLTVANIVKEKKGKSIVSSLKQAVVFDICEKLQECKFYSFPIKNVLKL